MNAVIRNIIERRSVRRYVQTRTVSENDLMTILKAGAYAPSAMNAQAWHFTAVADAEKLIALNAAVKEQMGASDIERNIARSKDATYNFYYHAPLLIIVSASDKAYYPREDAACALENMFLAAASLGLGSCWINQLSNGVSEAPVVRAVLDKLGVPAANKVYGCAAIGYASETSPMKDRASGVVNIVR